MDSRRMCPNCRAFITNRDKVCPYCNERVAPRAVDVRSPGAIMGGFIPHARFVTMMILTINCGLYLATVVFSAQNGGGLMSVDGRTLFEFGAKYRLAILGYGQWWRLVTAGFLHGGLLHIVMNSWVLFDLGAQVEEVLRGQPPDRDLFSGHGVRIFAEHVLDGRDLGGGVGGDYGIVGGDDRAGDAEPAYGGRCGVARDVRAVGGLHFDFGGIAGIAHRQRGAHRRTGGGIRGGVCGGHAAHRAGVERTHVAGGGGGMRGDHGGMFSNDVLVVYRECAIE